MKYHKYLVVGSWVHYLKQFLLLCEIIFLSHTKGGGSTRRNSRWNFIVFITVDHFSGLKSCAFGE